MKNYIILSFLLCIISCKEDEQKPPQKSKGIPNALQEKSVEVSSLKRKDADLVEVLYKELIEKDPSLKKLDNEINDLLENRTDSLKAFNLYKQNNDDYYLIYQKHLTEIQDSLLRKRMQKILDSSLLKYKTSFSSQQKVFDSTNKMYNSLSDFYWLLKLSKTLAVMETYQENNIPDTATLKAILEKLNNTILFTDSLLTNQ